LSAFHSRINFVTAFHRRDALMNSDHSAAPDPSVPYKAILALSLAAFASGISLRLADPLLPRLATEFSVSLGTASYVITFFSVAYGLAQLFFGPLGDRYGKYRVIAWACSACAVTSALCGLAPSFSLLVAARLLAGATAAAIIPLSMAWIGDVIPYDRRQPILARFLVGQILGLSTGVLMGGFTADHLSWRVPFFAVAAGFALISMVLLALNRRLPPYARVLRKAEGHALRRTVNEFGHVLSKRWARVVLMTVFLEGAFLFGAFAFIAAHLHHTHGISLSRAGSLVMLFGFGGLLFAMTVTLMVKRLGEVGLTLWGGVLICLSFMTIGLAPSWHWAIPGCFIAGLGFYMLHNTLQINATQMAPDRRGAAVASFACCFFLGQSVGVATAGLLVGVVGTGTIIPVGALGVLMVALNFSRMRRHSLRAALPG
jgi:predicted MFS family arabinose efflux permease